MDKDHWHQLGLSGQFGQIASEINRARYWDGKSDNDQYQKSLARALDLLALSIDCCASPGRKELTRFYEVLSSHYARTPYPISLDILERFCLSHLKTVN